ncbi:MAG: hypothetical protein GPJ54_19615 [Candidatus Heimdallarchaeota archaeon]|nr:hypothetical protein [Candidatus Heimdallarchaeota archaeon]
METIYFEGDDYDEGIDRIFPSDFFEELSKWHPIGKITKVAFYRVEISKISEEFFQPIKNSLRHIEFVECILPEIPQFLFKNLELTNLRFSINKMLNFETSLKCRRLKKLKEFTFSCNSEIKLDNNQSIKIPIISSDYKIFEDHHNFDIQHVSISGNAPSIDTLKQLHEILKSSKSKVLSIWAEIRESQQIFPTDQFSKVENLHLYRDMESKKYSWHVLEAFPNIYVLNDEISSVFPHDDLKDDYITPEGVKKYCPRIETLHTNGKRIAGITDNDRPPKIWKVRSYDKFGKVTITPREIESLEAKRLRFTEMENQKTES